MLLLRPRLLSFRNILRGLGPLTLATLLAAGISVTAALFAVSVYLLGKVDEIPLIATLLKHRLLNMTTFAFFWMAVLSAVITSLEALFAAEDLPLLLSSPQSPRRVFRTKWLEATLAASGISSLVYLIGLTAFAVSCHSLPWLLPAVFFVLPAFVLLSSGISTLVALCIGRFLSIARARLLFQGLFLAAAIALVFFLRSLAPEKLVVQEGLTSIPFYLHNLSEPAGAWDPARWLTDVLLIFLAWKDQPLLPELLKLYGSALLLFLLVDGLARRWYLPGVRRYHESVDARQSVWLGDRPGWAETWTRFLPFVIRPLVWRDMLLYLRTPVLLTQFLMLGAVAAIYAYNIVLLPIEPGKGFWRHLTRLFGFLNIGMVGFIVSAACLRFVYPVLALEGKAFYRVRVAPLSTWRYLGSKMLFHGLLFTVFSLTVTVLTQNLLHPGSRVYLLALIDSLLLSGGIVAWHLGLGIWFPSPNLTSLTDAPASIGGFVAMAVSTLWVILVLVLQTPFVFEFAFRHFIFGETLYPWGMGACLVLALFFILGGWLLPLELARRRLDSGEGIA